MRERMRRRFEVALGVAALAAAGCAMDAPVTAQTAATQTVVEVAPEIDEAVVSTDPAGPALLTPPVVAEEPPLPDLDKVWNFGDAAGTEAKFRAILPVAEASGDRGYELELRTQIARTLGLQRRFDEAHATLDSVERELPAGASVARARYLLERGRAMNTGGDPEGSKAVFLEAFGTATDAGSDGYAVDAAHMLGIVHKAEASLEWNSKALVLALSSSDPKATRWRWALANNTGWTWHEMGNYEKAMETWRTALAAAEEKQSEGQRRISMWCLGRGLRSMGRLEEALAAQRELVGIYAADGKESGYTTEEVAECLHALGRLDEARPKFARAHELLCEQQPWMLEEEAERMARLKELGAAGGD